MKNINKEPDNISDNPINSNRRKLLGLAGVAGAGAILSTLLAKAAPSTIIEAGSNVDTASYIIFKDGNTVYAKNGTTGEIEFQGDNATAVINSTMSNLISGGDIVIKDSLIVDEIVLGNNITLIFENGTILTRKTNATAGKHILKINGKNDVKIINAVIDGNAANNSDNISDCISIVNSNRVHIYNAILYNATEDGIYIGRTTTPSSNIFIKSCIIYSNNRNGISVTSGFKIFIDNVETYSNILHGVDIESNLTSDTIDLIFIKNLITHNNANSGINILNHDYTIQGNVTIDGIRSYRNIVNGISIATSSKIIVREGFMYNNTAFGIGIISDCRFITIENCHIFSNNSRGISLVTSNETVDTTDIKMAHCFIYNNSQNPANNTDGIRIAGTSKNINRVEIISCSLFDNQASATQRYGLSIGASGRYIILRNNIYYGNVISNKIFTSGSTFAENSDSALLVSDGSTISHSLALTPNKVRLTGTVAGEIVSVTSLDATNIKVAIKKHDGTPGAPQTIYWEAEV